MIKKISRNDIFTKTQEAVQIICYTLFRGALVYRQGMTAVPHERIREASAEMTGKEKRLARERAKDVFPLAVCPRMT